MAIHLQVVTGRVLVAQVVLVVLVAQATNPDSHLHAPDAS